MCVVPKICWACILEQVIEVCSASDTSVVQKSKTMGLNLLGLYSNTFKSIIYSTYTSNYAFGFSSLVC